MEMNKNAMNKASFLFKDAKLINLSLMNTKPRVPQYDTKSRSNSFENSMKRVWLNNHEMQSLITQTKAKSRTKIRKFHQSFIEEEEDYNKLITRKMLQFGKLLNKIPHPLHQESILQNIKSKPHQTRDNSSNTITQSVTEALPSIVTTQYKSPILLPQHSEGNSNDIESNTHIGLLKKKINNYFTYDIEGLKTQSKVLKRKAKLTNEQTRMHFYYFASDFNTKAQGSSEYKFIKFKEESFKVIRALLKVKQIIIEDYYSHYSADDAFILCNGDQSISRYLDLVFDIYQFYSQENEDLLHNYSVVTKCLVNDSKSYLLYITDLCSLSESIILEENKFKSSLDLSRKKYALLNDSKCNNKE